MFQATAGSVALLGFLAFSTIPSPAKEEAPDPWRTEGVYESCRNLTQPQPNFLLPANVPAPAGEFTCHADFKSAGNGWIRIFLVNRTPTPGGIGTTNGSAEFKAHRQLLDGSWEVVQPRVTSVMCADSHRKVEIHPGMFVSFEARFHPQGGHKAKIRYENNTGLVSNAGPGFWDPDQRDIANSPFQINALTLCDQHLPMVDEDLSDRDFVGRKVAKIDLQTKLRTTRACRLLCDHMLSQSDRFADDWREEARARLEALRTRKGAAEKPADFAAHCLDTLEKVSEDDVFGSPATYPGLCWQAFATLGRETENPEQLPWDRLFGVMESRLPAADFEELEGMARVLGQERFVHEFVPDSFLMAGMKVEQREFQARCVSLLLHRGATNDIIRIAAALDLDGRFAVTRVIATREVLAVGHGPFIDFILGMANQEPERTLDAIERAGGRNNDIYMPPRLSLALRPYLKRTAFKGLDEEILVADHEERRRMIRAMEVAFRDHIEVLKRLTGSKAFYEQRSTSTQHGTRVEKIHFMAAAARRALAAKGVAP